MHTPRLGLVIVLAALHVACNRSIGLHAPREPHVVKLRLKWSHHIQFAGFYVARERGYYLANGLDVHLLPGVTGSGKDSTEMPAIQMVASGENEFGLTGPESVLLARGKGVRIKALAAIFQQSPFCYIALESEGIRTLEDLKQRRQPVGVHFDSPDILTYRAMLKGASRPIRESEIREVAVPISDLTPLIGRFDDRSGQWTGRTVKALPAYSINEPIDIKKKYKLGVTIIAPAAYDVDLYGDTLFTTEEIEQNHPDLVDCFLDATIRGWEDALQDPKFAVEATLKADGTLDAALEGEKMRDMKGLIDNSEKIARENAEKNAPKEPHEFGGMTYEKWKIVQQLIMERLGQTHIDITKVFTNDHLPKQRQRRGRALKCPPASL